MQIVKDDKTVCKPGQRVSLLLQTVLFSLCGLPLSLSSIPLSLQSLVSLFCIFFSQISFGKLLAQLLYRGLCREQTPSDILQTQAESLATGIYPCRVFGIMSLIKVSLSFQHFLSASSVSCGPTKVKMAKKYISGKFNSMNSLCF